MKLDFHKIAESKGAFRKKLAARPIAEKLRMLDTLRQRTLAIRASRKSDLASPAIVQETPQSDN